MITANRSGVNTIHPDFSSMVGVVQIQKSPVELQSVQEMQHFGFQSSTPSLSHVMMHQLSTDSDGFKIHGSHNPQYILTSMAEGETYVYDKIGQYGYFKADGTVNFKANKNFTITVGDPNTMTADSDGNTIWSSPKSYTINTPDFTLNVSQQSQWTSPEITINSSNSITVNCPNVTINGNVRINGTLVVSGDVTSNNGGVSLNTHHHYSSGGPGIGGSPVGG